MVKGGRLMPKTGITIYVCFSKTTVTQAEYGQDYYSKGVFM